MALVAGYVAVLLSLADPELPFNQPGLSDMDSVIKLRDYLRDEKSWAPPGGVRQLRNQAPWESRISAELDIPPQGADLSFRYYPEICEGLFALCALQLAD